MPCRFLRCRAGAARPDAGIRDAASGWAAWGGNGARVMLCRPFDGGPPSVGNGSMLGFRCPDEATVDPVHALALAHGGSDEGGPGTREAYGPDFYVAYARDPLGPQAQLLSRPVVDSRADPRACSE